MSTPLTLMYVEDNLGDVKLLEYALSEVGVPVRLKHIDTWEAALNELQATDATKDQSVDLFLFDERWSNGKLGSDLLKYTLSSPFLQQFPAFVVSGTVEDDSHVILKPPSFEEYLALAHRLVDAMQTWRERRVSEVP